jgi:parallel beta-helix repeat protein
VSTVTHLDGDRLSGAQASAKLVAPLLASEFTEATTYTAAWRDKGGNVHNVKAYGATGDGATNDTSAIHSARTAAGANGVVFFPSGTYMVTQLEATLQGQHWILDGNATIKMIANQAVNSACIWVKANYITISGGVIDGNRSNQANDVDGIRLSIDADLGNPITAIEGIVIDGVRIQDVKRTGVITRKITRCSFRDLIIHECQYIGIEVRWRCTDSTIHNCILTKSARGTTSQAIQVDGLSDLAGTYTCERIHVSDCTTRTWANGGIFYNGTVDSTITGCSTEDNGDIGIDFEYTRGCTVAASTAKQCDNFGIAALQFSPETTITGCVVHGCGVSAGSAGIHAGTTSPRCTITGNTAYENTGSGIYIADSDDCTVAGNVSYDNTLHGIRVGGCDGVATTGNVARQNNENGIFLDLATGCTVNGNTCTDNGQTTASKAGIFLNGASTHNLITGNRCNDRQGTKTQAHGIRLNDLTTIDNTVAFNDVTDNLDAVKLYILTGPNVRLHNYGDGDGEQVRQLTGIATGQDPISLADGAQTTKTVTVANAAVGDPVIASFSNSLQGIALSAYVSAADTVTVVFQNETTGTIDLASGTVRAVVFKY